MKRPSATTRSARKANIVVHAQAITNAGAKRAAKAKTWAITITIAIEFEHIILLTDSDENQEKTEVVADSVEAYSSLCSSHLIDLLIHFFLLRMNKEGCYQYNPYTRYDCCNRSANKLFHLFGFLVHKL
jgi:hypothetical protein